MYLTVNIQNSDINVASGSTLPNSALTVAFATVLKGDKGDAGNEGPRGEMGNPGDRGERGERGEQGAAGERGPKGDKGDTPDISTKQDKDDEALKTSSKNVVEAINELHDTSAKIKPNALAVTITQTSASNLNYTFTKANFEQVEKAYENGAQIFIDVTDNRANVYKSVDLSKRYNAIWNKTLSQVECRDLARGFYISDGVASNRGAVSNMTEVFYNRDNRFKFNAVTGFYEYFDLLDITESEAINIYNNTNGCGTDLDFGLKIQSMNQRINFAPKTNWQPQGRNYNLDFYGCRQEIVILEAIDRWLTSSYLFCLSNTKSSMSFYSSSVRKIVGSIGITIKTGTFTLSHTPNPQLSEVLFRDVAINFNAAAIPNLNAYSVEFLIETAKNSKPITLTLHAQAYARLTPEIFDLATSKQISILSA